MLNNLQRLAIALPSTIDIQCTDPVCGVGLMLGSTGYTVTTGADQNQGEGRPPLWSSRPGAEGFCSRHYLSEGMLDQEMSRKVSGATLRNPIASTGYLGSAQCLYLLSHPPVSLGTAPPTRQHRRPATMYAGFLVIHSILIASRSTQGPIYSVRSEPLRLMNSCCLHDQKVFHLSTGRKILMVDWVSESKKSGQRKSLSRTLVQWCFDGSAEWVYKSDRR